MEYQSTSDIGQSCNKAIEFATARPTETLWL